MNDATTPAVTQITPPSTPAGARARRDEIIQTAGDKYRSGDAATIAEVRALNEQIVSENEGDKLAAIMAGNAKTGRIESVTDGQLTTSELSSAVTALRKDGLTDAVIHDVITGTPITAEQQRAFETLKKRRLSDREWVRKYREGDADARAEFSLFSAGVVAPVKE